MPLFSKTGFRKGLLKFFFLFEPVHKQLQYLGFKKYIQFADYASHRTKLLKLNANVNILITVKYIKDYSVVEQSIPEPLQVQPKTK